MKGLTLTFHLKIPFQVWADEKSRLFCCELLSGSFIQKIFPSFCGFYIRPYYDLATSHLPLEKTLKCRKIYCFPLNQSSKPRLAYLNHFLGTKSCTFPLNLVSSYLIMFNDEDVAVAAKHWLRKISSIDYFTYDIV